MAKAFQWIQHRHPVLRAHFSEDALQWRAGEDVQALDFDAGVTDSAAAAWLAERYSSPALTAEPMLASRLFGSDSNAYFLAGYFNHAATDWVSGGVIWNELWQAYEAYMLGLRPQIATASNTFEDFCEWEGANAAESHVLERRWTDHLAGAEPLPGAGQTSPCIEIPVKFESGLVLALQAYAKANSLSVPFILTALFGYACSNVMERRLAIGYYMSGRLPRFSHAVGCFSQLRAFVPTNDEMPLEARLKGDYAAYFATLDLRRPVPPAVADRLHVGDDICVNIIPVGSASAPRPPIGLAMEAVPAARRTAFRRNVSLFLRLGPAGGTGGLWVATDRISEDIGNQLLKEWLDLLNIMGVCSGDALVAGAQS